MTAQLDENLILGDGTKKSMNFCPPLPEHHPRLIELTSAEVEEENVNVGYDTSTKWGKIHEYSSEVSNEQISEKTGILGLGAPWRSRQ